MSSEDADARNSKQFSIDRQADLFRYAERDHGLTIPVLERRTKISKSTLRDWRDGTAMPAWAIFALGQLGGVPDELLSMLGEPFKRAVTTDSASDDGMFDDAAAASAAFNAAVAQARHPNGPGGTAIVPQERASLQEMARTAMAAIRRVIQE